MILLPFCTNSAHLPGILTRTINQGDTVMLNVFKSKRFRTLGIIGTVVIVALILAGKTFLSGKASTATMNADAKVVSVVAAETVDASGSLEAQPFASLTWNTSGVVDEVYVKAGDQVSAGDVLMKLNTSSVPSSVISAQADL